MVFCLNLLIFNCFAILLISISTIPKYVAEKMHQFWLILMIIISMLKISIPKKSDRNSFGLRNEEISMQSEVDDCPERMGCPGNGPCLACEFPSECQIGLNVTVNCSSPRCGQKSIQRQAECLFCWQLADSLLECEVLRNCSTNDMALHRTICKAKRNVICAGRRTFYKNRKCHWTSGHSWSKALFLSITLGGFGVDRFYLGHWKSGVGKLFSFGGLGIWTLLDIILISIGYIQPADESEYLI